MNAEPVAEFRELENGARCAEDPARGECFESRMISEPPGAMNPASSSGAASTRDAFDMALAEHRAELVEYLARRLGDREAAADLTQETLSRMMKYREDDGIQDRKLMLFRIANNLLLEYHRTRQRHHAGDHYSLEDTGPLAAQEPPVESTIDARKAINTLLKRTILELPPKCRLAFMLSRFDGLSYPQIAEKMGVSVKMVEKHITRALLACRAAVGDLDI